MGFESALRGERDVRVMRGDGREGPEGDVLKFVISTIAVPTAEMLEGALFFHLFTLQSALNSWQKLFHQLFRICVA